ncbi:hypothetical protein [Bartonella sp. cb54]|uniref:hypothetical protein n=1 Tax=Bartonella sp. cb54 TaxID=3385560 RepID=UPI0039A4EEB7
MMLGFYNANVYGKAVMLFGSFCIRGFVRLMAMPKLPNRAWVTRNTQLCDNAKVTIFSKISDNAQIYENV